MDVPATESADSGQGKHSTDRMTIALDVSRSSSLSPEGRMLLVTAEHRLPTCLLQKQLNIQS